MIRLQGLTHAYREGAPIFADAHAIIPGDRRVALLGRLESGKTTLLHILAGLIVPDEGQVERHCRVSFPASYQRGFRITSTARQNVAFAAKIYGADPREICDFVARVTDLGELLDRPMKELSVQERMMTSFALTYAIPFDTYLFDNSIATGLPEFRDRCLAMYEARAATAGTIVATRHPRVAAQLCDCALLIRDGNLDYFDDLDEALEILAASAAPRDPAALPESALFDEQS